MKIRCDGCGKKFDPAKTDGICPYCGVWHSPPDDQTFSGLSEEENDPWEEDFFEQEKDAPEATPAAPARPATPKAPVTPAAQTAQPAAGAQNPPPRPRRRGRWLLLPMGLLALLLALAVLLLPQMLEQRIEAQAVAYNRPEPVITAAQGDSAVTAPYTYRLVSANLLDYTGSWPMPYGRQLMRLTLAVSMVGERPDWDPEPPYLGLADGSWQLAMDDYDVVTALGRDVAGYSDFPYGIYYLDTPSDEILYDFYYLVPEGTTAVTVCFERYSTSRYGEKLEEIVELPAAVTEEVTAG